MRTILILIACVMAMTSCGRRPDYDLDPPRAQEVPAQLREASPYANGGTVFYLNYGNGNVIATPVPYRGYGACKEAGRVIKRKLDAIYNTVWVECTSEYLSGP